MQTEKVEKARELLEDCLQKFEDNRSRVTSAIQILMRAAAILDEETTETWCRFQLGDYNYRLAFSELIKEINGILDSKNKAINWDALKAIDKLKEAKLEINKHFTVEDIEQKLKESGGGLSGIGFIEEKHQYIEKTRKGNDGTYYLTNLTTHIAFIRKEGHRRATMLYKKYAFQELPERVFDVLRTQVESKLFRIDPELAEQVMVAFKSLNGNTREEYSQATATCRRVVVRLADTLFPARSEKYNGREVGENSYINRLWAFMDGTIASETDRDIAKAQVDVLGTYLQRLFKAVNKGVHSEITRLDAIKVVFHVYLLLADLLGYVKSTTQPTVGRPSLQVASSKDIISQTKLSESIVEEIVRLRVNGELNKDNLGKIKGIGPKKLEQLLRAFSI